MERNGFTLIELLVVVVIIGVLLAIGTLQFSRYSKKANMEAQVKTMYSDILDIRTQALFRKADRSIVGSANQFKAYPTPDGTGTELLEKTLKYAVQFQYPNVAFGNGGVAIINGDPALTDMAICVTPSGNPAAIDSIVIKPTSIRMGKWTGGGCTSGNIVIQ
jgi:prepilin-type N-terminal cleavage/methylation domain-containing protein